MNQMTEKPKIVFPCTHYPVKVIGPAAPDFKNFILQTVRLHDPQHDGTAQVKESSKGRFYAVSVRICAVNHAQIKALYGDLKNSGRVSMVI